MSYVKISDPAILDLAGIQQIISVVNQHSDYLNALINRFGVVATPDYEGDDTHGLFDSATSAITFGKATILSTDVGDNASNNKKYYSKEVEFEGISFSQKPFVLLTLDNSAGQVNTQLDFILSVHGVSTTGFTARAMRAGIFTSNGQPKYTIDNNIKVNWIAVGPR